MAVQAAFKQPCPSCEMLVPIRSASLIGKKIDCPKCKYRFVIEEPGSPEAAADDAPAMNEAELQALTRKPKSGKVKANGQPATAKKPRAVDDAGGEEKPREKKEGAASKKLVLGLGLGAVGLVVLAVAGFVILGGGGKKNDPPPKGITPNTGTLPVVQEVPKEKEKKEDPKPPEPVEKAPLTAGPELTNLLPADAEHVLHVFFKNVFNPASLLAKSAFGPG